jgi:chemotaxis protein CheC
MSVRPYSADEIDALHEVANVAMGRAGSSLAAMLDSFVTLSVPRSSIVTVEDAGVTVAAMLGPVGAVTAVRQGFCNGLRGEALVLFNAQGCTDLADLLGYEGDPDERAREELLLDVGNLLVGAVLNGLGGQLNAEFHFSPPSLMAKARPLHELLEPARLGWSHALLIEVNFALEARGFRCHMVLLMPEESIERMRQVLENMLADL